MYTLMNLMPLPLRQRKISPIIKQTKGGGNYGVTLSGTRSACKAPNRIPKWDKYINCSNCPCFMLIFLLKFVFVVTNCTFYFILFCNRNYMEYSQIYTVIFTSIGNNASAGERICHLTATVNKLTRSKMQF